MPSLPPLDIKRKINHASHVVLLGAGASLAAFPAGDANGRKLPLMRNLVEVVGLGDLLAAHGVHENHEDFEALYDGLAVDNTNPELLRTLEDQLHAYFAAMQLPEEVTLYDLLLLSLREKDVIATFNWDPFLAQAFRRNRSIRRLPKILFLHGNVEVGACREHRRSGFIEQRCSECGNLMEPSRLLFPVKHKDYTSDPFIRSEWEQLQWALERAYLVTIFGYSAPATDVEARSLLLNKWMENPTRELAEIDIVDIRPREAIKSSWADFFVRQHYGIFPDVRRTISFHHPRRSCEAFAMATLQQDPWTENDLPPVQRLEDLHAWLRPLLEEEASGMFSGRPCTKI
ncbi:conserved hypothetical protein [Rhodoferax ferrireducens T118]|uniref:Deacetylase sirtuin-type domain-containing protein n=1 Tax=Albidiferax ferrireducens (strain ATCC BAA-621 / DSM 15236 / T118) TaxID=338969 RepID=Q21YU9_ALBFT|nr:hypothetical protein [Rhodoferax ferrireducens]ABD69054.1 conserved hypothetical protein [Rhodoferax ferrireducens T118]